jgi:RNA recognition motif-containing protein
MIVAADSMSYRAKPSSECIRMNIYVGNLSYNTTEDHLRQAFEPFGTVVNVNIIKDRASGESRGFGFVEMSTQEEAESAIDQMNGQELDGRTLKVNEARPRQSNNRGGGGGGRGRRQSGGGRY